MEFTPSKKNTTNTAKDFDGCDLSNAAPLQFFGSPVRLQEAAVRRMLSRLDMCDTWTFCLHLCAHHMLQAAIP